MAAGLSTAVIPAHLSFQATFSLPILRHGTLFWVESAIGIRGLLPDQVVFGTPCITGSIAQPLKSL